MSTQHWNLDFLHGEIKTGIAALGSHINVNPPFIALISLIRELDVQLVIPYHNDDVTSPPLSSLYKFGWQNLFRESYRLFDMKPQAMLFPSREEHVGDAQMLLTYSGRIGTCQQYLEHLRYGMIKVAEVSGRNVKFEPVYEYSGVERFEMEYRQMVVTNIVEKIIEDREALHPLSLEVVQPLMRQTVTSPFPQFMSYNAPEEVWEFFQQHGHYRIWRLQEHENFGTDDTFGGIPYNTYVDAVEYLMGNALMHAHYAFIVLESHPQTHLANLLTYLRPDTSFIEALTENIDATEEQARQILECLTLDKSNYEGYTNFTAAAPPPFVRMADGFLLRSVAGCFNNPFQLLNYELKRRYEKDYFRAVNNREVRFRNDLFKLFPQEHIIKLNRGVNLTTSLGATDIDAVMYDNKAGTIALIQLKWPDGYGDSMRRRASVMTNYYSKANEWVEKIYSWVKESSAADILGALQILITQEERKNYKGVYIMVINRHTAHFTSGEPSDHAAWGSWAQVVATMATGLKHKPEDPLGGVYSCLLYFDPKRRTDRGDVPQYAPFDMEIGTSRLSMP